LNRLSIILLTVAAFAASAGQLLFKVGAQGRQQLLDFINPPVAAGLVLYGLGTAIWIYVLSSEKLVNVYAFTALTFVLVYLGGIFLIGEKASPVGVIGILLILSGLYLLMRFNA
jgi:multidrug transporter EmrE-like cation transporter